MALENFSELAFRLPALPRKVLTLPRNGRSAALIALLLADSGMGVQQALSSVLDAGSGGAVPSLPPSDRHLCSELVYGYLRTEDRIAFVLGKVLPRPETLPHPMVLVLGMAVYALLFQDRVPDHAAVHSAVGVVRHLFGQGLSRVANGALRSVQRMGDAPHHVEFYAGGSSPDAIEAIALFYAVPLWIARQWVADYGMESAVHLLQRSFRRPWSALRVNAGNAAAQDLLSALLALGGESVGRWGVAFPAGKLPQTVLDQDLFALLHGGALSFQSAGSQLVLEELGLPCWAEPVWDVCAGFGGKSVALLERGVAVALATDLSFSRLSGLPAQCARLALQAPVCALADAVRPPLRGWTGHILVDAPCSGLGVLARRPDIRRKSPQQVKDMEAIQARMLTGLLRSLEPGRQLAYITCTLRCGENDCLVDSLLASAPDVRLLRKWQTPHDHPWLEGMFGAVLEKV